MRTRLLFVLLLLSTVAAAAAAQAQQPPRPDDGTSAYILVLEDPATSGRQPAPEPDVARHGGSVLHKHGTMRHVRLPRGNAQALCNEPGVAYLQRIWEGEAIDEKAPPPCAPKGRVAAQGGETDLTWASGTYLYDGSGNIRAVGDERYAYDTAGRLIEATFRGTTERYAYDSFGNLREKSTVGAAPAPIAVDPSSNRLTGVPYDAAGNVTARGTRVYRYDSVGMLSVAEEPGSAPVRHIYTADDERLGTFRDSRYEIKVRDLSGKVMREYSTYGFHLLTPWVWVEDYVYAGGQMIASEKEARFGAKRHFHQDHLGSVRMITNDARMRLAVHDYTPFGAEQSEAAQEVTNFGNDRPEPLKFTGHERDTVWRNYAHADDLDYIHARYYSANLGRFLSVDPVLNAKRHLQKPQGWNRYSYVENSPINNTDPTGRCTVTSSWFVPCVQTVQAVGEALWEGLYNTATNSGIGKIFRGAESGDMQLAMEGQAQLNHEIFTGMMVTSMIPSSGSQTVNTTSRGEAWVSAEAFGASVGLRVAGQMSGKMSTIATEVTAAKMSQSGAATAVDSAVRATGLRTTGVVKVGDNLVVGSVQVGTNKPVMVVTPQGIVRQATATIEAGRTDIVIKDIKY
ncbi:MAG: RHS repeat-associated core domain-containing protein [Actinomycetota bacterium]|nr:RHS repeat-associated core domain-containing protein [Actinomycetota bacterium]